MGAAVATIMFLIVFIGVIFWLYIFRMKGLKDNEGA